MQIIFDNLISIQWWLGVVLTGIVINLLSIFLKNRFDSYFSKISSRWRNRSEKRRREYESEVNILKNNLQELIMASFLEIRRMNQAIVMLLFSIIMFVLGVSGAYLIRENVILFSHISDKLFVGIFLFMGTITLAAASISMESSFNIAEKIRAAKNNYGKKYEEIDKGLI